MQLPNNLVQLPSCPEFDTVNQICRIVNLGELPHPETVRMFPRHPKSVLYHEFMLRARRAIKYEHSLLASTNPIRMALWLRQLPTLYRRGYVNIEYPLSGATFIYTKMFPKGNRKWNPTDITTFPLHDSQIHNYFNVYNFSRIDAYNFSNQQGK